MSARSTPTARASDPGLRPQITSAVVARLRRGSRRREIDARCARCGYDRSDALVFSDPILCAVCDAHERGVSDIERHHVAGRANSPFTIALNANTHREITALQVRLVPQIVLRNPDGLVHLRSAAWLYGIAILFIWLAEHLTHHVTTTENESHNYGT